MMQDRSNAARMWGEVCAWKRSKLTLQGLLGCWELTLLGFLGCLATFSLQVAPAWVDVGSDWVNGGWALHYVQRNQIPQ